MARWEASAKWAAGPALDDQRATPLGLGLNEGLGSAFETLRLPRADCFIANHFASRAAPGQEPSRYPASAAHAGLKQGALRRAVPSQSVCILDRVRCITAGAFVF